MFWNKKNSDNKAPKLSGDKEAELIAIMVHQLRSPLSSIRLAQQLLLENEEKNLTEKQLHLLKQTVLQADYVLDVVNMLLLPDMMQRILGGTKTTSRSVESLLDTTIEANEIRIREKAIEIVKRYDTEARPVQFVHSQLHIVFSNVIDNAIKYTPQKGEIAIATTYSDNLVQIDISNTGESISEEDQKNVFEKYRRTLHAAEGDEGGSGLGLYIAKQIIERHKGSITYSRNKGRNVFSIAVPIRA